ncbi:Rho GDP-dissociation inhibitor like [Actinidia chinensis var. chinensis]|uniref:Rho GDP-dissociation inhibitor like n=1 Tax=Actinidia chinensis var. chinensis TaxID=1590841 RepID=A0A2R6QTD5_ACTCC|nr:Rho GDP-dissociation inhibitor like [Actinidia chinensis var. chinensis]
MIRCLWPLDLFLVSNMGLEENTERGESSGVQESGDEREGNVKRSMSESSLYATEEEEEDEDKYKIEQHLRKDKDDESLRRWKEQLLGSVDMNNVGETLDSEVKILSLSILSPDRSNIVLPIPEDGKPKGSWFTLKEGSRYSLRFSFQVGNNIVSGLKYTNTVWKSVMKVDSTKEMLGTFSPHQEPYTHVIPEETTPLDFLLEVHILQKQSLLMMITKCYLEINYKFDIKKDWATP